jgi:hypothetical protein
MLKVSFNRKGYERKKVVLRFHKTTFKLLRNKNYLVALLAGVPCFAGAFFNILAGAVFVVAGFALVALTAGFAFCLATGVFASCFTTGAAKEMPPKRRAPARIKLNFFMILYFLIIIG